MSVFNIQNMQPQLELVMFARGLKPKEFYCDKKYRNESIYEYIYLK
jgi:hypothetical protein